MLFRRALLLTIGACGGVRHQSAIGDFGGCWIGQARGVASDSIGGYRLLRRLGEGPRAEVWLGHPERSESQQGPVAIKVFRTGVPANAITLEAEALSRATGPHCSALLDLETATGGAPALIIERYAGGTAGRLIASRSGVTAGEAITLLAPLAMTVARLHEAGVVHGGVRLDAVMFDVTGAPRLCCFGRARLIEPNLPEARLSQESGVVGDLDHLAALAGSVLALVPGSRASELRAWLDTGHETAVPAGWSAELGERLFDLAEPEPLDLARGPDALSGSLPSRVPGRVIAVTSTTPSADDHGDLPTVSPRRRHGADRQAQVLPDWVGTLLPEGANELVGRLRAGLSIVRPRFWIAAGLVGVAVIVAALVVPSGPSGPPGASPTPTDTADGSVATSDGSVSGDDPARAQDVLLEERGRCLRDLSILCLDAVDQAGSQALEADRAVLVDVQSGAELPAIPVMVPGSAVVTERLGDSAIVTVTLSHPGSEQDDEPASVLLMKGEAGWRIRDQLSGWTAVE